MAVYETSNWREKGVAEPLTVTVVWVMPGEDLQEEACKFLGCRRENLMAELRSLRDRALLLTPSKRRLTKHVRVELENGELIRPRGYVFRNTWESWRSYRPTAKRRKPAEQ